MTTANATANAPSYTAGNQELSMDLAGNLRVGATFTPSGTQDVNLKSVNGVTVLTGAGATGTGSERVTVAVDSSTVAGSATLPAGTNNIGAVAAAASGTAANAPSNASTTVYASGAVIKASAGLLYGLSGYNSGAAQWILLYNSTTVPADTAQAVVVISVPATSNFFYNPGIYGRKFTSGIAWSNSSTSPAKTVGGNDCFVDAQFA